MPASTTLKDIMKKLVEQFQTLPKANACIYLLLDWVFSVHRPVEMAPFSPATADGRRAEIMLDDVWEWVIRPRTNLELLAILNMECSCSEEERRAADHASGEKMDIAPDSSPGWCLVIACFLLAIGQAYIDDVQPLHRFNHR
jgi:hypothetical protein